MNSISISRAINQLHPDARQRLLEAARTQLAIQNLIGQQHSQLALYTLAKLEGRHVPSGEHHERRNGRCRIVTE